jgi:hypothetical protein
MKNIYNLLLIVFILIPVHANAQYKICKQNGEKITCFPQRLTYFLGNDEKQWCITMKMANPPPEEEFIMCTYDTKLECANDNPTRTQVHRRCLKNPKFNDLDE